MKSVGNMGGIICRFDEPVIKFKCDHGTPVTIEFLTEDKRKLPIEFWVKTPRVALLEFLTDQVTPDTRQGIHEELAKSPCQYYDVERMLRYSYGYNIDSVHWIKQDNDISCWVDTELEGIGVIPINSFYEIPFIKKLSKTSVLLRD